MTQLLASDLHLGAGASLGNRLADQESSWCRFCTTAAELGAGVLWAGDSHHHRKPSPAEFDAWQSGLRILREGGCTMLAIPGNHCITDAAKPSTIEVASAGFDVFVARGPQVIETEDGPVGFLPWAPPTMDARRASEALMIVAEELARQGARILVAHHALSGASLPTGLPVLELAEPILDSFALAQMGFHVVLSGHIHKLQVVVEQPLVAHVGPLCRGNFGEAGIQTGAWQIESDKLGLSASWFEVPDRHFSELRWDLRGEAYPTEIMVADITGHPRIPGSIARASWYQTSDQVVDQAAVLEALHAEGVHHVDRLEPIVERAASTRSAGVSEATDPRESWDRWLEAQGELAAPETLEAAREEAHERIGAAT